MSDLATKLRVARAARGWTQSELSAASGVAQSDISEFERGYGNPTARTVDRLFTALGGPGPNGRSGHYAAPAAPERPATGSLRPVLHSDDPEAVEWLAEAFLSRGAVTLLAGAPGAGKSLLAQSLAAVAVNGGGMVGAIAVEPGRVCVVDGENGEDLIQRRFTGLEVPAVAWGTRLRVFTAAGFDLVADLGKLDATMSADPCDVLVLDGWASLWSGSEASVTAVKLCLGGLRDLAQSHRLGIILIHHTTKGTDTYRGSGAVAGTLEAVFTLTRGSRPTDRVLTCEKMRLGPEPPVRMLRMDADGFR